MNKGVTPAKSMIPWAGILNLLAAVVYGASPIDLIPDFLLLIGWVDDAIAIPLFLAFSILGFVRNKKRMQQNASAQNTTIVDVASREPQIPTTPY